MTAANTAGILALGCVMVALMPTAVGVSLALVVTLGLAALLRM